MKLNLGNGLVLEDLTIEDVRSIIKESTNYTVKVAKSSTKVKSRRSSCNNKLDGRREDICRAYFVNRVSALVLAEQYGVTARSLYNCLKVYGVKYGFINNPDHSAVKYSDLWNV
jgi:hypothetical protein